MSNSLCVSFVSKKGISCIVLMHDGKVVNKKSFTITDEDIKSSSYLCLIQTFISTLRLVKVFIDSNSDIEHVTFEVNNSIFIKWVYNNFSKDAYQDLFHEAMLLLNEIPIKYNLICNKKPLALKYFSESTDKVRLSRISLEDFEDD